MARKENIVRFGLVFLLIAFFLINIVSAELPTWSSAPITIDKEYGRIEFAQGDIFSLEANFRCTGTCRTSPVVITWRALRNNVVISDIVFRDPHASKTIARVADGAQTGNIQIEVYFSLVGDPNGQKRPAIVNANIVSKPPAPKIVLDYDPVQGHRLKVNIWKSEVYGTGNNFIVGCSFVLKDIHGKVMSANKISTVFGKIMPKAELEVKTPDVYEITASCIDSHGSTGNITEVRGVNVALDRQNTPVIVVDKTKNCIVGNCSVAYYINSFEKSLNVTIQDMTSGTPETRCNDEVQRCNLNSLKPGTHTVKIKAKFLLSTDANGLHYSNPSEAIITVYVSQQQQTQQSVSRATVPERQPQPVAAATLAYGVSETPYSDYRLKRSPGAGGFALIAIFAILGRKLKIK